MICQATTKVLLHRISVNADKAAFSELFKRYHSKLVSFATCFLSDYVEAEDAVSEVFVKLLQNHQGLQDIENFEGYIYYSVKNRCLNQLKKNKRQTKLFTRLDYQDFKTGDYTQPLEQLLTLELREKIAVCVDNLPQKRQLVYKMIKDEGLRISEVSKLLDITEKTVKKHLELAVRDLKENISAYLSSHQHESKIVSISSRISRVGALFLMFTHFFETIDGTTPL